MIHIRNLSVELPGFSLTDVDLHVEPGQFFVLLGPTGSGKTLILESITGLLPVDSGQIQVNGRDVSRLPPEKRDIGIVYQNSALFPHLNVRDNIEFGLRYRKTGPQRAGNRFDLLIETLGLKHLLNRSVTRLSGGEQQRVALARALVVEPKLLLLDEPLSALDPNFREEIRESLNRLHQETGITVLMVTHDFGEARYLAQKIAVINHGRLEQTGDSEEIFHCPATPFVARFVGMHNLYEAVFNGSNTLVGCQALTLATPVNKKSGHLAFRPEDVKLHANARTGGVLNPLSGVIESILHQGIFSDIRIRSEMLRFRVLAPTSQVVQMNLSPGKHVLCSIDPESIHVM